MTSEISQYSFHELSINQLYDLIKLRIDVFVVEQNCAYEELDNQDQNAQHVLVYQENQLIGYARILFTNKHLHIGRIVVSKSFRGKGIASKLLRYCMDYCAKQWPKEPIYLSAQVHLQAYYEGFGFLPISEVYDWDGIDHVDMKLN